MNELVTCDLIIKLHDMAYHEQRNQYLGFKPHAASGLTAESVTLDGLRELINKIKSDTPNGAVESPKRFSGYSVSELITEIKRGQCNFRELCTEQYEKQSSLHEFIRQKISSQNYLGHLGVFREHTLEEGEATTLNHSALFN